jgi:uncharacterized protein
MPLLTPPTANLASLLALNTAHAVETSLLTDPQLAHLIAISWRTRIAAPDLGLCIALDQSAPYDNPNFNWFRARFDRFVYVDRVIVAEAARGQGVGNAFYADLFDAARSVGQTRVCCEINQSPPNPASDAFHAAQGFVDVGQAILADRGKTVRYLVRDLQRS